MPEYLNSFRLTGNDQLAAGCLQTASSLLSAQKWLDSNTWDLVDESDAVLAPSYELVYTNGEDKPLSGTPYRWTLLLSVLDLVQLSARNIHERMPHDVDFKKSGTGEFDSVRILIEQGGAVLMDGVINRLCEGEISFVPLIGRDVSIDDIKTFIQQIRIGGQLHQAIKLGFSTPEDSLAIGLLRGLFAWGYLSSALRKGWFVDYGLHRSRCMSAVPYQCDKRCTCASF